MPSAEEIDAWPTQAMQGSELADLTNEMARTGEGEARPAATQAVRVQVWRAADGVHVAPVGTPVASPTVEAMLVALDASVDLAHWLARPRGTD